MVLEKLGQSLRSAMDKITHAIFVDERLLNELIKEIQRALLQADVNVKLVFDLSNKIKERAKEEKPPKAVTQKEHLIKIVYEELTNFLGGEYKQQEITQKPHKIMLVGLYGSGKTTSVGKIAKYFYNRGKKVATIQTDTYRPAAYTQLKTINDKLQIPTFGDPNEKNALTVYKKYETELQKYDIVIIDTAGRDKLSEDLIKEIDQLHKKVKPQETILVISADLGQTAQSQAQQFHEACHITGVLATKMDGTAKAGGAITACAATGAPLLFIGVGEKVDDLEEFNPKRFVGRLLGMGDLEALLEKARLAIPEEKAEDLSKKFIKGEFNFLDLYDQLEAVKKMGPLSKVLEMIPGLAKAQIPKEAISVQEEKLEKWKYALQSMTKEELEEPELLNNERINRIAKGSHTAEAEVRELLKQYKQAKKLMKTMGNKDPEKMLKKFKGKVPGL